MKRAGSARTLRSAPNRRARQRRETRERLFQAALEEFRSVGFQDASIDRIAESAGVARATFYFHFPTKEHVLLEHQRRSEEDIVARLRALGPHPDDVGAFCRRVYRVMNEAQEGQEPLRRDILAMYARRPMRIELAAEPLIVDIVDWFHDAAERGAVRRDAPPEQLAIAFLSSLFSWFASDQDAWSQAQADLAVDIFVRGVSADPEDHRPPAPG